MRTKIAFGLAVILFLVFVVGSTMPVAVSAADIVDAGNKFCPISGDKVSGKDFVTYQGKHYGLCCPMCDKKFLGNPEKYIAQMTRQEAGEAAESGEHMH